MSDVNDFLIELGTEELPPKSLKTLSDAFGRGVQQGLEKAELSFAEMTLFAAPRRLAILIKDLREKEYTKNITKIQDGARKMIIN